MTERPWPRGGFRLAMTTRSHPTRLAGTAIAAALALGSTPLLAQGFPAAEPAPAEPVLVLPESPPPTAPAPTIVLPEEPTVTAQPQPAPSASTTQTARPAAQRATAAPTPARQPPAAAPAETPVEAEAEARPAPMAVTPVAAPAAEPVAPVAAADPPRETAQPISDGMLALVLGSIAVLALAFWGFVALGRRKPPAQRAAIPAIERPLAKRPVATPPAPLPAAIERPLVAETQPEPVVAETQPAPVAVEPRRELTPQPISQLTPATAGGLAHAGASVALPRRMPESFEERAALINRMVDAKPDRANPFTSPIQRRHRAKLILQSLGREFGDQEPWIDLSQYPNNWPELARRSHAA